MPFAAALLSFPVESASSGEVTLVRGIRVAIFHKIITNSFKSRSVLYLYNNVMHILLLNLLNDIARTRNIILSLTGMCE